MSDAALSQGLCKHQLSSSSLGTSYSPKKVEQRSGAKGLCKKQGRWVSSGTGGSGIQHDWRPEGGMALDELRMPFLVSPNRPRLVEARAPCTRPQNSGLRCRWRLKFTEHPQTALRLPLYHILGRTARKLLTEKMKRPASIDFSIRSAPQVAGLWTSSAEHLMKVH